MPSHLLPQTAVVLTRQARSVDTTEVTSFSFEESLDGCHVRHNLDKASQTDEPV